jgi:APA family basic amino acid/polyamine antiporter
MDAPVSQDTTIVPAAPHSAPSLCASAEPPAGRGSLGLAMALSLVIGTMIGGGIFVLPASLAPMGWNAVLGWIISGGGALCLAASLRFLMQGTGEGFHTVVERVLGPLPAFLAIWAFWLAGFVSIAALSVAAGSVAADMLFAEPPFGIDLAAALVFLAAIAAVNLAGARSAGVMQVVTVVVKLVPLVVAIALIAAFVMGGGTPQPLAPTPIALADVSTCVAITLFALLGFEMVAVPVQKIRNPGRNVPIALLGGTGFVVAIYVTVSTGLVLMLPWQEIATSGAPVSDLLTLQLGPVWGGLTSLFVLVAMVGCVNGLMFVQGDCAQSMAVRGELPAMFARTNARGVAHWGILVSVLAAGGMILSNVSRGAVDAFTFLITVTSGGALVFYGIGVIAAISTNRHAARWPAILGGLGFTGFATYGTGLESALWVWPLMGIGLALRWLNRRSSPLGAARAAPAV